MGQTLSEPITEKGTSSGSDERLIYAASSMQGWRITMEDSHTTILKVETGEPDDPATVSNKHISIFAVFDGHGGASVAKYAGQHIQTHIGKTQHYKDGQYEKALKQGFLDIDQTIHKDAQLSKDHCGCTAIVCLYTEDDRVFCANAGDSRAVLSAAGVAVPLSFDHKPFHPEENKRIIAAGGFVEFGRVNGDLALSRALGDFSFKDTPTLPAEEQIVTAFPDVIERAVASTDEFMVLACDGIWDVMSNQQVIDFVSARIADDVSLPKIAEDLMDYCMAPMGDLSSVGSDNMTVVIVGFHRGKSVKDWMQSIRTRVANQGGIIIPSKSMYGRPESPLKSPIPLPFGSTGTESSSNGSSSA